MRKRKNDALTISSSHGKGRGVFARRNFCKGDTIEICSIIRIPGNQVRHIDKTILYDYYFGWGRAKKEAALALGLGSLYNHSYEPNAAYRKDMSNARIIFIAIRKIKRGEEVTVNYGGKSDNKKPLWFNVK